MWVFVTKCVVSNTFNKKRYLIYIVFLQVFKLNIHIFLRQKECCQTYLFHNDIDKVKFVFVRCFPDQLHPNVVVQLDGDEHGVLRNLLAVRLLERSQRRLHRDLFAGNQEQDGRSNCKVFQIAFVSIDFGQRKENSFLRKSISFLYEK